MTVSAETDTFGELYGGKKASDLQNGVEIVDGQVNGTLYFIEGGLAPSGYLAGDGWFLALKWSDPAEGITSLKVGLNPSIESGLVECINDNDRNGVFKISSLDQRVTLVQTKDGVEHYQSLSLAGLTLGGEKPESDDENPDL